MLPPEIGLVSSVVPVIMYSFFGTSRQLTVGPTAIMSLLVAEAIDSEGIEDGDERLKIATLLVFFVGVLSILLGLVRFGSVRGGIVANLWSHSVIVGFTAGAAVVIALSQLKHLLGFPIPRFKFPIEGLFFALEHIPDMNPTTAPELSFEVRRGWLAETKSSQTN